MDIKATDNINNRSNMGVLDYDDSRIYGNYSQDVSLTQKYSLNIIQASKVFGIGISKMRKIVSENPCAYWLYRNGNRVMIKRELFAKWLDEQSVI
ncbi:MAG: excisionase [Erysipelotrichaceae bacterium]|nr:excisionase [Erysipelotrichaceae bacterium]